MRYVLDANAAIAAMNDVGSVRPRLSQLPAADVGIPIVAIGELLYGAHKSRRRAENLARIDALRDAVGLDRSIPALRAEDWLRQAHR